ncbi:Citrate/oxoglutarate carrier protein [Gracilariopsis chorda]|uniref:Citrate/oxoglutarate carrier protein n=1 Tax=Gracilariopsis chorda TaxID=448386 RepID=A0A2V3IUA4_9FLOR|nr:Citrate/oxoglutarate carrier protein [Gracilariopsis chorda]|eukprot:PXF44700.1 Citrate/oxoglutarate carrier protein [Gracilariopsis chorda]
MPVNQVKTGHGSLKPAGGGEVAASPIAVAKGGVDIRNVAIGAGLQWFEVTTLGQPFENMKVMMAAHRNDGLMDACRRLYAVRGLSSFWQGLVPWAWIEALTKGEYCCSPSTKLRSFEVTRSKTGPGGQKGTLQVAAEILQRDGIRGMYKGVNAVALRQATNWGSRFGLSRLVESAIKGKDKERKLSKPQRILSSIIGGALACWNQPFEVVRVEMQRADSVASNNTIGGAVRHIYETSGLRGFYRGVTPRVGLSAYLTTVMVFGGDEVKTYLQRKDAR